MADVRQYRQDTQINHGTTAQSNLKLTDIMPVQHENLATQTNSINKISLAQCLCEPYAVCNSNNPSSGNYTATCENFPDFALSYTDSQGNSHNLIGLKVRVKFTHGITYGSVSGGTYPTLNINGSGAVPLLAQGKTMATGAVSAGQTIEFTIIPYGNGVAFDADSNVRESTSDYTIYTDGLKRVDEVASGDKNMVTSSAVANVIESINENLFPVRIGFYEAFNIVQGSSDSDIWWRVFEGTATNEQYSYMYIEITVINIAYIYAPPNVTKYIVSPQIGSDPSPSVLQLYKTNTSCHGCRVGKDSNNHWFVDLHLRANNYQIFTQGIGYKRSEKQSKVTMDNFTFVSAVGD